jgi:hypothetical protein
MFKHWLCGRLAGNRAAMDENPPRWKEEGKGDGVYLLTDGYAVVERRNGGKAIPCEMFKYYLRERVLRKSNCPTAAMSTASARTKG